MTYTYDIPYDDDLTAEEILAEDRQEILSSLGDTGTHFSRYLLETAPVYYYNI